MIGALQSTAFFLKGIWRPVLQPAVGIALTAAILTALLSASGSSVAVLPWTAAGLCLAFLLGGLGWASVACVAASAGIFLTLLFAPDGFHQTIMFLHVVFLWACFSQFLRADMDREAAVVRREDRLGRLRLETERGYKAAEVCRGEIEAARERIAAYNRLRSFADDLIGAFDRGELSRRAREGLKGLFPRAETNVTLFPVSGEPDPLDEMGRWTLRQKGARLYPNRSVRLPAAGEGRFLLLPLRGRDAVIGWVSLERSEGDHPFLFQDLRLALIAADLIVMSLGNAERYAQVETLAISDGLTGVYTRGYLNERLLEEFAKARHQGRCFSLLMLDIDHFKKVNDTHGHHIGDEVLRWLARQITAQCRETDFVARYGGEEFVVLMPNTRGKEALSLARRIREAIEATPFRWENASLWVTVSGGVSVLSDDLKDELQLLSRADQALYRAKEAGRNQVLLHE